MRMRLLTIVAFVLTGATVAIADSTLKIGHEISDGVSPVSVPVLLDTTEQVQGFVVAFAFDPLVLSFNAFDFTGAVAPEFQVATDHLGGITYGAVMDFEPPFFGQTIGPGNDILLMNVIFNPLVPGPTVTDLTLVDGVFGDPALDNVIVVEGLSIGQSEGLALSNGSVTIIPLPAAVWAGLGLLGGLGAIGTVRRRKRR